jgi:hypothetical protein
MAGKTVKVPGHRRSTPKMPPWPGPGKKPGPKPVPVDPHRRKPPSQKAP